ncbi:MAG: RNA polymerase sigma factor [Candidatus Limnocylindrales bacterium]|jgi:RNA polymerase sigma-70 factor (ECF subfamily)
MFVKEAYLGGDAVLGPARPAIARGRAFDTVFVAALEAEMSKAYRLAGFLLADSAEAQDAVQEASVRAWRGWAGLRDRDRFHPWFSQILVNVCRTRLRQRARRRTLNVDDFDFESTDPFRAALARDAIGRALGSLSQELRMVVVLRYWGELSLAEIADRLRIPIGTVKSRHHAALQALRRRIEPVGGENP